MNIEITLHYQEEFYKNTLVLWFFDIALFKNVRLDLEDDYYYTLIEQRTNKEYLASAVGTPIFLKQYLAKEQYDSLKQLWNNNNIQQAR